MHGSERCAAAVGVEQSILSRVPVPEWHPTDEKIDLDEGKEEKKDEDSGATNNSGSSAAAGGQKDEDAMDVESVSMVRGEELHTSFRSSVT